MRSGRPLSKLFAAFQSSIIRARLCAQYKAAKCTLATENKSKKPLVKVPEVAIQGAPLLSTTGSGSLVRVQEACTADEVWKAAQVYAICFRSNATQDSAHQVKDNQSSAGAPESFSRGWREEWELFLLTLEAWLGFRLRMKFRPNNHRLFIAKTSVCSKDKALTPRPPRDSLHAPGGASEPVAEMVVGIVEMSLEPVRVQVTSFTAALLDLLERIAGKNVSGRAHGRNCNQGIVRRVYLYNLATHPDYRRRGIARYLLAQCESQTRAWQHRTIYLHVERENAGALSLYKRAGFRVITAEARQRSANAPCLLGRWVGHNRTP
jgi:GNAT superfamily N-acetyltransferase